MDQCRRRHLRRRLRRCRRHRQPHYGPGVCDVDGDGDLDLWVDNASGGMGEQLQINDGSGVFADETGARVDGNTGDDDNGVVCVDFDYDGDFDAVVVALSSAERYLDNDGSGNFSRIDGVFPGFADSSLWAEFGDLDGDARLDLVTGSGESGTIDRYYLGAAIQPADTTPPGFRAVQTLSSPIAADEAFSLRFAVFDNTVTDEGARLTRAWVQVAVDGGDATEIDAHFVGGDLLHAVIPGQPGDAMVELTPCASDWAGNEACAPAQQVQIGPGGATTTAADSGSAEAGTGDTSGGSASASASASEASASASASATGATAGSEGSGAGSSDTTAGQDGGGGGGGGGCGCVVGPAGGVAHEPRTAPSWLVVLGGLLAVRRRRVR
ncbi:MAG: VCBS repeat-containing protein [Nannocystaceae bacterium]